jgi:hypothetical protein
VRFLLASGCLASPLFVHASWLAYGLLKRRDWLSAYGADSANGYVVMVVFSG